MQISSSVQIYRKHISKLCFHGRCLAAIFHTISIQLILERYYLKDMFSMNKKWRVYSKQHLNFDTAVYFLALLFIFMQNNIQELLNKGGPQFL